MNEWKKLWKQKANNPKNTAELIQKLNRMEKKARIERQAMIASFALGTLLLLLLLPVFQNLYYAIAFLCFASAMVLVGIQHYKNKYDILVEETLNNKKYLQKLIEKLNGKMRTLSMYMFIYTFLLLAGFNIAYLEALRDRDVTVRVIMHFGISIGLLLFMFWTLKKRQKKLLNEIEPLKRELEKLQN